MCGVIILLGSSKINESKFESLKTVYDEINVTLMNNNNSSFKN